MTIGNPRAAFLRLTVAAALCLSAPAFAQPCWSGDALAAAKVRELQAMMMAVTLRCAAHGASIHDAYNGFVTANMDRLNAASATLRQQFGRGAGGAGQAGYDRYTTELSNRYGSGHTSTASCAAFAEIAARATRGATASGALDGFASQMIPQPHSVGEACPVTTAANEVKAPSTGR